MAKRSSNRNIDYRCSVCGEPRERDRLVVKQVRFYEIGEKGKLIRTRTVAWIGKDCCLLNDEAYTRKALAQSPGMADTHLASLPRNPDDLLSPDEKLALQADLHRMAEERRVKL